MVKRKIIIYIISIMLITFGTAGTLLSVFFFFRIRSFSSNINEIAGINTTIARTFESITATVKNTSITADNLAVSLDDAKESLLSASETAEASSKAVYAIADITNFNIMGFRPMAEASQYFTIIGENLTGLSENIKQTADSLETNQEDMIKLGNDFKEIFLNLETMSLEIDSTMDFIFEENPVRLLSITIIYLAFLHFMFIITGLAFFFLQK